MQGIAEEINKGKHDLYLLEELWMEPGRNTGKKIVQSRPIFNTFFGANLSFFHFLCLAASRSFHVSGGLGG